MTPDEVIADSGLSEAAKHDIVQVWHELRRVAPSDDFYGFGFYTTYYASYLSYTAFSEQGLSAVAAEYLRNAERGTSSFGRNKTFDDLCRSLRWSPADSPHHGSDFLPNADPIARSLDGRFVDDELDVWMPTYSATLAVVLRELAAEGLFGDPQELVLNVWEGDQSHEDRVQWATLCNPPALVERFTLEELAGYAVDES